MGGCDPPDWRGRGGRFPLRLAGLPPVIAGDGDLGMFSARSRYDLGTISVCSRYLTLSVLGGQATIVTRGTEGEATPGNCRESRVWCLRISLHTCRSGDD